MPRYWAKLVMGAEVELEELQDDGRTWKPAVFAVLHRRNSWIEADFVRTFEPPIFKVEPSYRPTFLVGVEVSCTRMDERRPTFIAPSKVQALEIEASALLREMELPEREVSLVSYVLIC